MFWPLEFGVQKINEWQLKGIWSTLFRNLVNEPDTEWEFIDGTYVKAHQHRAGARGVELQAIGKSRAVNTTKIHLAVDSYGLPIEYTITGAEVHYSTAAREFIEKLLVVEAVVADKGYDSEKIRAQIKSKGSNTVIPRKSNSVIGNADMDWALYCHRHLVENAFAWLNHFRALATRYDKLKRNYHGVAAMACGFSWLPM